MLLYGAVGYTLDDLSNIPSVIRDFQFFAQPKYRIASGRPGSGNTKNIGSITKVEQLVNGDGPFAIFGEEVYDDYWMYYLTADMARKQESNRPYINLKSYFEYKQRAQQVLQQHVEQIKKLVDDVQIADEEEAE